MELRETIENIAERAKNSVPINDGDYIKDGLLYCNKCHTPKQCVVTLFDEPKIVYCQCKCEQERVQKEFEAEYEKAKQKKLMERVQDCFGNRHELRRYCFGLYDDSNDKLLKICMNYVDHFRDFKMLGKGLLFYGDVGIGKTFFACCIANALLKRGYACKFTSFRAIINNLWKAENKNDVLDDLERYQLLIIDDYGIESMTEYTNEMISMIINVRCEQGLPLIMTTNLKPEELKNPKDISQKRVMSRLLEMTEPIEVKGFDRRRENYKKEHEYVKSLLYGDEQ